MDLEINHIHDQLRNQSSRGLKDVVDFVRWLRDIRNDLAHLVPVSHSTLLEPRFQERFGRDFLTEED